MPAKRRPKYTLHKPTGQARVRIDGKDHYLGAFNSPESRERYDDLIADWVLSQDSKSYSLTIDDLALKFLAFADGYYRRKDGTSTDSVRNIREALRYPVRLYGSTRARDFGPKKLKAVREAMIDDGRCRTNINRLVHSIRRVFRWGVEEELVPANVYQALMSVSGLRAGRSAARESDPIQPVADDAVEQTLKFLPPVVADMVRFQRLTGCRPGEVCMLRPCDVDRRGEVWRYIPESHKTTHHGRQRVIMIGPKAQAILRRYLLREDTEFCFSPSESERQRLQKRHQKRETPMSCGNTPGSNRKPKRERKPGSRYNKDSLACAIRRACDKAFPPPESLARRSKESVKQWKQRLGDAQREELKAWKKKHRWSPNQLRHTASTEIRRRYGLEAAQVVLGHATADVTQVYAERDMQKAAEIMRRIG